jgi:heme-degrading monooxygenase HmoA
VSGYVYLWEYRVRATRVAEFEIAYGAEGDWVRLFRRADGYLGTELLRDLGDPLRFVTVDRWTAALAYEAFHARFAAEFEAIDRRCAELTDDERLIGRFMLPAAPAPR